MRFGLNLLYLLPGENGGTETYASSLLGALAAQDTDEEYVVFLSREAEALTLPDSPRFRRVVCPVRAARREARYAYEQTALPALLRREGIDLLHSLGYVCPLRPGCPSVVTIHDLNYLAFGDTMSVARRLGLGWFVTQSARRADHVLTVSHFSKGEIERRLSVPPDRITVTHEGPRPPAGPPGDSRGDSWGEIAARYGLAGPYVMAFGSSSANKNLGRLCQAFAGLGAEFPHALVLAGRLPPETGLGAEIARMGLGRRVIVTGYVPDAHVMPLLGHADLFAFPSLYEGFGLPALEAQAAGVAVACSTAASLPEVAGDGAAFFDPLSVEDMGRVLADCLRDPAERAALVARGRANVARFSWEQTAAATRACYHRVLGASP